MKQNLNILIVEDETIIAMELEDMLEDLGHTVVDVVGSVTRAMSVLEEHKAKLDAVLLDANLAGTSSLPVANALDDAGIPYVVTSGYEPQEILRDGFDAPCIVKPYRTSDIQTVLDAIAKRVPG